MARVSSVTTKYTGSFGCEGLIGGISRDHELLVCCCLLEGELDKECECERCMCDDGEMCTCVVLEKVCKCCAMGRVNGTVFLLHQGRYA
jgi:hypothetical protein